MNLQLNDWILIALLTLAVYFDLTRKKIPNYLTLPAMGWGIIANLADGGAAGFRFSFYGLLLGLGIFLIPFALGWLGGGDVKLLGAVGALEGAALVFHAALFSAICGAIIAVGCLLAQKRLKAALKRIFNAAWRGITFTAALKFNNPTLASGSIPSEQPAAATSRQPPVMPYGVAIALGTLFALTGVVSIF
ncbi:MAG TPA: A24 family peptidase [Bacillota bacterium]|nr:A24 family peptidase [Bacillota bacterium]